MSQGNQEVLRFSLEESVWFQKGQEVAELISISLDPNITIQENDQYVTIQGALQLTGEFKRVEEVELEETEHFYAPKFVHSIEERSDGTCEFTHRFPVDITIPNNRIQSVYDIDVEVETFDYVFPERSCLKLTADLTITGLYGEQQHNPVYENSQSEEVETVYPSFESEVVETDKNNEEVSELELVNRFSSFEEKEDEKVEEANQLSNPFSNPVADLYTPFEVEARKQPETEQQTSSPVLELEVQEEEKQLEEAPKVEVNTAVEPSSPEISFAAHRNEQTPAAEIPAQENEVFETEVEVDIIDVKMKSEQKAAVQEESSSSSSEPKVKKKKKSKKKSLSLTEFFARKEDANDVAKLKVCIVQNGDTLDRLAERYEVSVQQILKMNRLEINQDVHEGQVLYIPDTLVQN